jgi:hypothetical protein
MGVYALMGCRIVRPSPPPPSMPVPMQVKVELQNKVHVDWKEIFDQEAQCWYFFNESNGESSWYPPFGW